MDTALRIENVGKRYRIGALHPGYATLREALGEALLAPFRRRGPDAHAHVWALREVNLEVRQGELVGVIGRNGAGKSTLLKVLSRVTKPTTGRENVFLSGAILGMHRAEIERKFDEIVAFSETERFIDTPVKHYSSGMYVRLAFAVAAHLEPEILMMDEVLAVGDAAFQQKCLDKMHDIRQQGRTILFVSHNMPAVVRLCRRVVLLREGRVAADGAAQPVVSEYLSASWNVEAERAWDVGDEAPGDDVVRLRRVRVRDEAGETAAAFDLRWPFGIEVTYDVLRAGEFLTPHVELHNEEGVRLFSSHDTGEEWRERARSAGRFVSTAWVPGNLLAEGHLLAHVSLMSHRPANVLRANAPRVVALQLIDGGADDSARGDYTGPMPGVVRPLLRWTTSADDGIESSAH
ncbi:MAG TPA: ABC transporter ATP-binding protein [Pyrinomonadaceae bacterium]